MSAKGERKATNALQRAAAERKQREEEGKRPLLISLEDAAALGIERVRLGYWANRMDHFKIDIIDGKVGPWVKLYAPFNKHCNGRDPMPMLITMFETWHRTYEVYRGPLPDSVEYLEAAAAFDEGLASE